MPGISNELIMSLTLQYDNFIKGMRESKAALKDFQKDASQGSGGLIQNLKGQFGQINKYYELIGDSSGAVKEKMSLLSSSLRDMVKNGQGNSDMAQRLSGVYKNLAKESIGAKEGVMGIAQNFLKSVPGVSQMSGAMGQITAAFPQFAAAAGPVGAAILAIGAAYKYVVMPGIEFNSMLEQQSVAFTSMLKSGDKAQVMLEDLKKLSLTTPINLGEGATSAKQMLAYGFAQNEVIDNLKMMKTVASAVGVNLNDLTYVYGTLRAQGRAYTRDLMQFAMRGIPIYEYLSKTMGVSVQDLKKMTEEGKVGFKEVEAAMQAMTGEGGKFNGMLEASMKTTQGLKTQIGNTWQMFTGAASEGSSTLFKGLLTSVLSLVQELQQLAPSFNAIFSVISALIVGVLKGIVDIMRVFGNINIFIQNIILSITDVVAKTASWLQNALHTNEAYNNMLKSNEEFSRWLTNDIPILKEIFAWAGKIKGAIDKWWKRDKGAENQIEYIQGEFTKRITASSDEYQRFVLLLNRYTVDNLPIDTIAQLADTYGISIDQALKIIANFKQMSVATYNDLLRNTETFIKVNANYWKQYRNDIMGAANIVDIKATDSVQNALAQVEDALTSSSGFTADLDMAKLLGMDSDETKANIQKAAGDITETLYKQIEVMRNMVVYKEGEGKTFLDGLIALWNKYNDMLEKKGGGKGKKSPFDDILRQYIEFRAEYATEEKGFNSDLVAALNERVSLYGDADITNSSSMLDRQLAEIDMKYNDLYKKLAQDRKANDPFPLFLGDAIEEMRRVEKEVTVLKSKLEDLSSAFDLSASGRESVQILQEQYKIQMELNALTNMGDEQRIANAKALYDIEAKLVDLYLKGDQAAMTRRANQAIASGVSTGDIQDTIFGTASLAASGTEASALIGGADPMTLLMSTVAKLVASIDSVQQVLNLITVFGKGINSMIEGPMNKALKYLPAVFTKLGETVGAILIPFIEIFADNINLIATPLLILGEFLKRLFVALKPLIKLIMYLSNPILWLGNMLTALADSLGAFLATEEDRQADLENLYDKELATLQNLYEVGALSGAQYEARLAELKARYGQTPETGAADPQLVTLLTNVFDAIDELGVSLDALFVAAKPVLDFLILLVKPVFQLLITLLAGFFSDIAKLLTAVSNLATAILKGDWSAVWSGLASLLKSVLAFIVNPLIRAINWVIDGIDALYWPNSQNFGRVPELAVGTGDVPSDMMSVIHEGEAVVPSSFMDAIRSGDLALTGGKDSMGSVIEIHNHIEGSVVTERDLSKSVYENIVLLKRRGML